MTAPPPLPHPLPNPVLDGSIPRQQTLQSSFECTGVGLHSGLLTRVRVLPEQPGRGRYFVRVDLDSAPIIPARIEAVSETTLSTELSQETASVRTVEHLLAALIGLGVDNARIEIDGPEVPLLDGSAQEWVRAIAQVGLVAQEPARLQWSLHQPFAVQDGDAFVVALPAATTSLSYGIEFDQLPAIGRQWHTIPLSEFIPEIAPARTFGFANQIEQLRARGLIKGGSLENALVCGPQGWLNPPLRFANEPVRHKLLDLVGDLSLLGVLPQAHFLAYKASHRLHTQLAAQLAQHCRLDQETASV
jgi:UDP-3-O-[3-hydroxymyristoyl] N-acetylglucosamine deacetylase